MNSPPYDQTIGRQVPAWLAAALFGVVAPTFALLMLADGAEPALRGLVAAPILAVALMGAGMIAAAAAGRFGVGIVLAMLAGVFLIAATQVLGMQAVSHPISAGLAMIIASVSFAARGALFARSAAAKGWLIAVFVVAGEAAILFTAAAMPGALPGWLLALLPAQWASIAIQSALSGSGTVAAGAVLIALLGTAAATLLVAKLWPRRWPYLVMFTTWLALSALVWHQTGAQLSANDDGKVAVLSV